VKHSIYIKLSQHLIVFPPAVYWPAGRRDCATALRIQSRRPKGMFIYV